MHTRDEIDFGRAFIHGAQEHDTVHNAVHESNLLLSRKNEHYIFPSLSLSLCLFSLHSLILKRERERRFVFPFEKVEENTLSLSISFHSLILERERERQFVFSFEKSRRKFSLFHPLILEKLNAHRTIRFFI